MTPNLACLEDVSSIASESIAHKYAPWILTIIVFVLVVLLGLVGFFFLAKRARDMEGLGRALIVYVFALIVAVFTSFLAVVVTVGAAPANEFKFSWAGLSITLIGPPAIWAAASWFMTRSSIITALERDRYADVERRIRDAEKRLHWEGYYEWKERVGNFKRVIGEIEVYFIEDLLPKVYYHGQPEYQRMRAPEISTLFVYATTGIAKLQIIRGAYTKGELRPHIYLPSTPSTPGGQLKSIHCIRENGEITEIAGHRHGEWKSTSTDKIDYLVCTLYENDQMPVGDYLYVDTTKYLKRDGLESGRVSIAIVANRGIKNLHTWELRASSAGAHLPVPLIFRELRKRPAESAKALDLIEADFGQWVQELQQVTVNEFLQSDMSPVGVGQFMKELWRVLEADPRENLPLEDILKRSKYKECRALSDLAISSVLITTFEWAAPHRVPRAPPQDDETSLNRGEVSLPPRTAPA